MDLTVAEDERSLNRWETALFPPPSPLPPSVIAVSVVIYSKGAVSSAVNALCFNLRLRARCTYTPCPAPFARTLSVPPYLWYVHHPRKTIEKVCYFSTSPSTWRARILPCPRRSAGMHATVR